MIKKEGPEPDKKSPQTVKTKPAPGKVTPDNKKSSQPKPARKRSWSARALFFLIVFLAGAAGSIYMLPTLRERLPVLGRWVGQTDDTNITIINQRIDAQQALIESLNSKTATLEAQLAQSSKSSEAPALAQIEARIASLEELTSTTPAVVADDELPAQDTSQAARIDLLLSRMSQLEASFVPLSKNMLDAAQAQKERQTLSSNTAQLSSSLLDMEVRLGALERAAASDDSALLLNLSIAQLKRSLGSGRTYTRELESLRRLIDQSALSTDSSASSAIELLSTGAASGLKTTEQLNTEFRALIPTLINAQEIPDEISWWQNTMNRVGSLVTVRRTDGTMLAEGGDIDGQLIAIEIHLARQQLQAAMSLIEQLPAGPLALIENFRSQLNIRLKSDAALEALETAAMGLYLSNRNTGNEVN